jgi:hypothetical protein
MVNVYRCKCTWFCVSNPHVANIVITESRESFQKAQEECGYHVWKCQLKNSGRADPKWTLEYHNHDIFKVCEFMRLECTKRPKIELKLKVCSR